jgi:hypothetical protein
MESNRHVMAYCDCGHLSIFHLMWMEPSNNRRFKCFGADRDWYFRTFGNVDYNEEASFPEVIDKETKCPCTRGFTPPSNHQV